MSKSVLIIEDEPLLAMVLEDTLVDSGHLVRLALTGSEGWAELETAGPLDVLVTDIRLPQVDGWALSRRARELDPHLPVIYMSGDSASDHLLKGVTGSMMLSKPFALDEFAQLVASQLG